MKTLILIVTMLASACLVQAPDTQAAYPDIAPLAGDTEARSSDTQLLVLGGGCFWCLEAVFELVPGVRAVRSGYAGGHLPDPTYEAVLTGRSGHAEVVQIEFDPKIVALAELFDLFFRIHDPTTKNRQGADIGPQYRSVILYGDTEQRLAAEAAFVYWDAQYSQPVVTELVALQRFWPAEDYHQDYFRRNPEKAYCQLVIAPKVQQALQLLGE